MSFTSWFEGDKTKGSKIKFVQGQTESLLATY